VIPSGYEITLAVAFLPTVFLVRAISQWGAGTLLNIAGLRVVESVRAELFARIQRLPVRAFSRMPTGDFIQRLTTDVQSVRIVLVDVANDILVQPFTLIFALGVIVFTCLSHENGILFLASLGVVPISVLLVRKLGKASASRLAQSYGGMALMSSIAIENLQSPREVRAYNLEDREIARYGKESLRALRDYARFVRYEKALSPLLEFVAACGIAFAVWVGADSGLKLADLLLIITALYMGYDPVKKLGRVTQQLRIARVGLARIQEVLNIPDDVPEPEVPVALEKKTGHLQLQGVGFAYDREPVLRDIHLDIPAGQSVALVGPSGSGKSTLINLIPRFFDPSVGTITFDGINLRSLRLAELRGAVALVSQEPVLFNETIRENIRLGRLEATDDEVENAARLAGALEFIQALPEGMDTPVGERGTSLSGGQRQRVAIARAFLRDAPVLLLDEATSALDTDSERAIQGALRELMRGRTTLIIAHRFSTIRDVDRVVVLDAGRVVADGTREAVYATNALFKRLWDQQAVS
jgi:subfamily B ATP-binding cassette protein MsbA